MIALLLVIYRGMDSEQSSQSNYNTRKVYTGVILIIDIITE